MRRLNAIANSVLAVGFALSGTIAVALPTDMGRSADVYTNAVRYFAAVTTVQVKSPQMRPASFADLATPQEADAVALAPSPEDAAFEVSLIARASDSLNVADAIKDKPYTLPLAPREVYIASSIMPHITDDNAFAVPLQPRALASLDIPEQLVTPRVQAAIAADIADLTTAVGYPTVAIGRTAGSSRTAGVDPTLTADIAVITPKMPEDLLDQMAAADSNFVVREGEGDAADTMMMSSDVLFSFGKAELSAEAEATLTTMLDMLTSVSTVEVFGHTDSIGSEQNNLALGQKRAEAVRAWLLSHSDFTPEQIIATGIGETDPFVPNTTENGQDDPVARAQNRRVEFAFQ